MKHLSVSTAIDHLGKLSGALLGMIVGLGFFGFVLGFLLGALMDELSREWRILRLAERLFKNPFSGDMLEMRRQSQLWVRAAATVCMSVSVLEAGMGSRRMNVVECEIMLRRTAEFLGLTGRKATLLHHVLQRFRSATDVDIPGIAAAYAGLSDESQQESLLRFLWSTAADENSRVTTPQDKLVRSISEGMGTPVNEYGRIRAGVVVEIDEFYEILGIPPDSSTEEVKRVYRTLASQFHPDHGKHLDDSRLEQTEEAFRRIHDAYTTIMQEREG